jgi:hypothetical protein
LHESHTYQQNNWDKHVPETEWLIFARLIFVAQATGFVRSTSISSIRALVYFGLSLGDQHSSEIALGVDKDHDQDEHKNWVVSVPDRLKENGKPGGLNSNVVGSLHRNNFVKLSLDQTHFETDPARHRGDTGDGRSRRVDEKSEFLAGDAQRVNQGSHTLTGQQSIGVVVEKNDNTNKEGSHLTGPGSGGVLGDPSGEANHTSTLFHHGNDTREEESEKVHVGMADIRNGVQDVVLDGILEATVEISSNDTGTDKDSNVKREFHLTSQGEQHKLVLNFAKGSEQGKADVPCWS